MTLLIDGHNLIGAMPDVDLADPDDEQQLLARLRAYRSRGGANRTGGSTPLLIVFFDSTQHPVADGLRGRRPEWSTPGIEVHFSGPGQSADDAILAFLRGQREPGQYAVVTNDQELAWRARAAGASVIRASDFATRLSRPRARPASEGPPAPDPHAPEFADLFRAFLDAEKTRAQLVGPEEGDTDPALWVERLYGDDIEAAQRAARWLGRFGGAQALGPLRDALTHGDVRVRSAALLALGDLGDRAAVPDLCDRLAHDPGSMAREAAAQSLARLGDRSAAAALEAAARSDPKSKVRKAAREALEAMRVRRAR